MNGFDTLRRPLPSACLALCLAAQSLYALDPARPADQYSYQRWSAASGFPAGRVNAIGQSADGYLWVGTERGLMRFDGQSFRKIEDPGTEGFLPERIDFSRILGLAGDRGGVSWVLLPDPSLLRYENGTFTAPRLSAAHDPLVTAIARAVNGSTLFGSKRDGLFKSTGTSFQSLVPPQRMPSSPATSIAETASGDIWLGTADSGLVRIHEKASIAIRGLPGQRVTSLLPGPGEQLYVGTDQGLVAWNGTSLTAQGVPAVLRTAPIRAMLRDRDSNVWIGSERGLYKLNSQGAVSLAGDHAAGPVTALFEDREGDLWAGSTDQLLRIQEIPFSTYRLAAASALEQEGPVHADSHGDIWLAPGGGSLVHIHNSVITKLRLPALAGDQIYSIAGDAGDLWLGLQRRGLARVAVQRGQPALQAWPQAGTMPRDPVYAVHRNRDGTIWIGTVGGGAIHITDGRLKIYTTRDGLASDSVLSIAEGAGGAMWFGTPSGLSNLSRGHWRTYGVADGLPSANTYSIFVDSAGVVWAGTVKGLAYVRGERGFAATVGAALQRGTGVLGIAEDHLGSLWLVTADSVLRIDRARLLAGTLASTDVREFGASDGLVDPRGVRRDPAIAVDSAGTVWISRMGGVVSISPERLRRTAAPALVHISQLVVDGNPRDFAAPVELSSGVKRVSILYEGLNLSSPDRIRYRFKLDGFDRAWNESGTNKEAIYTNLSPGSYKFHVTASSSDQILDGPEAALLFKVIPAAWQTVWFQAAVACSLLALGILAYRLRMHQMTEQVRLQFETRFAERNRIARDLHDTLLQSFHGLLLRFKAVENMLPDKPAQARESIAIAIHHGAGAITEARDAIQELRGEEGGSTLIDTLSSLGQELSLAIDGAGAASYRVLLEGTPRQLHPAVQDDLYRISREAVANAFRHARAAHIELDIRYDPRMLRLRIRDDGVGMEPGILANGGRDGHWGLPGMQERAQAMKGQLEIWSDLNRGTEIELTVPGNIAYMRVESRKHDKNEGPGDER